MFRKTHSNQDRSVLKEIKKEFSGTFSKGEGKALAFLKTYPSSIFISMVMMIICSSIIAFVFTPLQQAPGKPEGFFYEDAQEIKSSVSGEISTILNLSERMKRISILKSEVERVIQQEHLSEEDSIFLENAILELEYFNNKNAKNYED